MSLEHLRKQIDRIDEELIRLLNERVRIAREIGKTKKTQGGEIYVPSREKAVVDRIAALNNGPLPAGAARAIYREIMSASLALEGDLKIAYPGPSATFAHHAALSRFGASVDCHPVGTITDVFTAVERDTADYGVVPVEDISRPVITDTLDGFTDTPLKICAEIYWSDGQKAGGRSARFFVIGRVCDAPSGDDKTSICFSVEDENDALRKALDSLEAGGIRLIQIEPYLFKNGSKHSRFFADVEGHADEPVVKKGLTAFGKHCTALAVLGSYPKAGGV